MANDLTKKLPDGRRVIHWFRRDDAGPVTTPEGPINPAPGAPTAGGVRGCIACDKTITSVTPVMKGQSVKLVPHSDDPRAATCPACLATPECVAAMKEYAELAD